MINRSTPHHTTDDFPGTIGRKLADSEPFFEQEVHPGEEAPNVVMVLLEDTGFAQNGSLWPPSARRSAAQPSKPFWFMGHR